MNKLFEANEVEEGRMALTQDAIAILNQVIVGNDADIDTRSFILHNILCAVSVNPVIADMVRLVILSTLTDGVDATLATLRNEHDLMVGPSEVERALNEGIL